MLTLVVVASVLGACVSSRLPYIVNGKDADYPGKWPWQASLQFDNDHSCGASIISTRWLVTAAHCVGHGTLDGQTVVIGMHDRVAMKYGQPKRYTLKRIITHAGWDDIDSRNGLPNDIALLQLSEDADLSSPYASSIQLASKDQSFIGSTCYITGWGRLGPYKGLSDVLQEARVDVYTKSYCNSQYKKSFMAIQDLHICVGNYGNSGSCSSDSGGPLACKTGKTWTLAGVTSWGDTECSVYMPDVYTRISYYRDWIRQNTGI